MLGSLGFPELLFILVLALLIFGPRKLPEVGRTLGRALGEFRRATTDLKRSIDVELSAEESRPSTPVSAKGPSRDTQVANSVSRSPEDETDEASEPGESTS